MGVYLSIDHAGRLILPEQVRDRLKLSEGSQLELWIDEDNDSIELKTVSASQFTPAQGKAVLAAPTQKPGAAYPSSRYRLPALAEARRRARLELADPSRGWR